jgi:hypothetical protein
MNTIFWFLQIILAVKFATEACTHLFRMGQRQWRVALGKMGGRARLALIVSAVCADLGAVGLIVPAATGILPWLTPLAAALLALLMLRGILFHIRCRARPNVWAGIIVIVLCALAAYGRWVLVLL